MSRTKSAKKAGKTKKQIALKKSVIETKIRCIGDGYSKILHCKDQKNQGGIKGVLWAGSVQKISLGCSSRSRWESFDEQED